MRWLLSFLLCLVSVELSARTHTPLHINVFSVNNGLGLEAHRKLFRTALESFGHIVTDKEYYADPSPHDQHVDVNVFMEVINPKWFSYATKNWLVPHPEWFLQDIALLDEIDLILCFTHEAERVFQALNKKTYFSGFTSFDCYESSIKKHYRTFFHAAGGSDLKGTFAVVDVWKKMKKMSPLTVICHWLPNPFIHRNVNWIANRIAENDLRTLQNKCGIHLCPSETEGFGHYIMEAMSAGAVVVTTDAPPMNEFITDKRCLVPIEAQNFSISPLVILSSRKI